MKNEELVPAIFCHIQKTGGTSIVELAKKRYKGSIVSHDQCWGKRPSDLSNIMFISGHIGFDYARHLMPGRYSFTFLRDPIERILSMYYFCKRQDPNKFKIYRAANKYNLEHFLTLAFTDPLIKKNIWNSQVWQLAHGYAHLDDRKIDDFTPQELLDLAFENIQLFSHVGTLETYERDKSIILNSLRIPNSKLKINETPGRPTSRDLSPACSDLLANLTQLDRIIYTHVLNNRS